MEHKTIAAVGIDVSKGTSTVAVHRPGGEVVLTPFQVNHDAAGLSCLVKTLRDVGGDIRIVMEHTGMYWRLIALALKDVRRFNHKGALMAFAGMDAPPFQSGTFDSKSRPISKRGSPHLRKTLFMVASTILQHSDPANPVFQFMDKKRAEGKHFYVYMVAGAAKFRRVYYARVKAHLTMLDSGANTAA